MADPDPTLREIIDHPDTEDSALTWVLTQLGSLGFPTASWQTGSVIFGVTRMVARLMALYTETARDVVRGVILQWSTGAWLDLILDGWYDEARIPSTIAQGTIRLAVASGSGPYAIVASQVWIKDAIFGLRYFNLAGATLPAGPSATDVLFSAESPGAAYSLAMGTGLSLITSLPGVTATLAAPVGSTTWLSTQGTDAESDPAAISRARAKWATIGLVKTADAYSYLARTMPGATALPSVLPSKVFVDGSNPRGPNTIDIWYAGPTGALSTADEATVRDYLRARAGINDDLGTGTVGVGNAEQFTVTVNADVYVWPGFEDAIATATDAVIDLVNAMDIGGKLQLSDVHKAVVNVDGVDQVDIATLTINGVAGNLQLAPKKLAINGAHTLNRVTAT